MNKSILLKAGIVLGFFAISLGLAYGCTTIKDRNIAPEIDNREGVYVSVGDIEITNQELWDSMKISDGVTYLVQYAEEMLLDTYIKAVTDTEIANEVELLTYGTNDPVLIAEIKEDADLEQDLIDAYEQNLVVLGFDPQNPADVRSFVELSVAKTNFTKEFILNADEGDALEVTEDDVEEYYDENTKGDVCVLDIRFSNDVEAAAVLKMFNIVENFEDFQWGFYNDSANVDYDDATFNDTNTDVLDDDEAFTKFIEIYNYMHPGETPVPTNTTLDTYCDTYTDSVKNYEDMTRKAINNSSLDLYANYIFDTLRVGELSTDIRYSYKLQAVGEFEVLVYKVSQEDVPPYESLSAADKAAVKDELVDTLITSNALNIAMEELWLDNELEVFDPVLKLQYEFNEGVKFDNHGDETLVARLGETDITATQLFNYMEESIGVYSAMELVYVEAVLGSTYYSDIYGDDTDFLNSNLEEFVGHRDDLRDFKNYFSSDGFASMGYSSATYTWDEFIVLYLRSYDEETVIRDISVVGNLQNYLLQEAVLYENAVAYMEKQAAEYFSLNVEHLLIYVDMDGDFEPDPYNKIIDGLAGADLTEYNDLIRDFEDLVLDSVNNQDMSFNDIVKEFEDGLVRDSENKWAPFKAYGFYIMTQDLSKGSDGTVTSLTYNNTNGVYDENFVLNLKRVYDNYVVDVENSIEDVEDYFDTQVFASDFGVHYLYATEGTGFEQPTAAYDDQEGDFSAGSSGTTVVPNKEQVELYIAIQFAQMTGQENDLILPTEVYDAIEEYYGALYTSHFASQNNSMPITIFQIQYLLDNNGSFTTNSAAQTAFLEDILEVLKGINYPEEYTLD